MSRTPYTVVNPTKGRCHASVMVGYHSHQCSRTAKNSEEGHEWCQQHTHSVIQAKYEARTAKLHAHLKAGRDRQAARSKAEDADAAELKKLRAENKRLRAKVKRLQASVDTLTRKKAS